MKKLWFRNKTYGYGWVPVTWQGRVILIIFVAIVVLNFFRIDAVQHSVSDLLINFVPQTVILMLLLTLICYMTGEKPGRHWGNKKDKK